MRAWGIITALLCASPAACKERPRPASTELAAGDAALQAWREQGLPGPRGCAVLSFRVERPSADEYTSRCRTAPDKSWGCLNWTDEGGMFGGDRVPVVVASPHFYANGENDVRHLIVHELMHALVTCASMGPSGWDAGDRNHTDARVWSAAGGEKSAQSKALKLQRLGT